jgi:hypothetical protein
MSAPGWLSRQAREAAALKDVALAAKRPHPTRCFGRCRSGVFSGGVLVVSYGKRNPLIGREHANLPKLFIFAIR